MKRLGIVFFTAGASKSKDSFISFLNEQTLGECEILQVLLPPQYLHCFGST